MVLQTWRTQVTVWPEHLLLMMQMPREPRQSDLIVRFQVPLKNQTWVTDLWIFSPVLTETHSFCFKMASVTGRLKDSSRLHRAAFYFCSWEVGKWTDAYLLSEKSLSFQIFSLSTSIEVRESPTHTPGNLAPKLCVIPFYYTANWGDALFKRQHKTMFSLCLNSYPYKAWLLDHTAGHSLYAPGSHFLKLCPVILLKNNLWKSHRPTFQLKLLLTISFITLFPVTNATQEKKGEGVKKVVSPLELVCFPLLGNDIVSSFPWLLRHSGKLYAHRLLFSFATGCSSKWMFNKYLYMYFLLYAHSTSFCNEHVFSHDFLPLFLIVLLIKLKCGKGAWGFWVAWKRPVSW